MSEVLAWRVFYGDGSTYGSEDGPPENAPGLGFEVVAQPDPTLGTGNVGYQTISGNFVYFRLDSGLWYPAETSEDVLDLILAREPITGICRGRRLPDERFREILAQARVWAEAQRLPEKSGYRPDERAR